MGQVASTSMLSSLKMVDARWVVALSALGMTLLSAGCRTSGTKGTQPADHCPATRPAPPRMPYERPEHALVEFWLTRTPSPDAVVLTPSDVADHNERVRGLDQDKWSAGRWDLLDRPVPRQELSRRLLDTLERLTQSTRAGKVHVVPPVAQQQLASARRRLARLEPVDEVRLVRRSTPLRCYPLTNAVLESTDLTDFDLGQCSHLHFGEAVRVLGRTDALWYVWTSYASGWVDPSALSGPLDRATAQAYLHPDHFAMVVRDAVAVWSGPHATDLLGVARLGLRLPLAGPPGPVRSIPSTLEVSVPGSKGVRTGWIRDVGAVTGSYAPLTRRNLFRRAFSLLHTPYGWGGMGDKRDCSRLLMDLFGSFGLLLPRNSAWQSKSGVVRVNVAGQTDQDKQTAIEAAAQRGIVLLYLPGHIMLYLGRHDGHHFALHQFSGYLVPCPRGGETMNRANRTAVTSLDLGRGSSRNSFIERITRLVVFGRPEGVVIPPQAP